MSVRGKLNHLFNLPGMRLLIPLVNKFLTFWKRGVWTNTKWNQQTKRFEHYQQGKLIHVDVFPYWACSVQYLRQTVLRINLCNIDIVEGNIIVDLGAGTGTEALIFSSFVGERGKVYAIEAHPETFFSLSELVAKGGYSNIFPFQVAIGNKKGSVSIDNQKNHETNAVSFEGITDQDGIVVDMITLDEFVRTNNIERIDFLKVNIEGAERYILDGMKESIHLIKSAAISCHDFLNCDEKMTIMQEVRNYFEHNGFKVMHKPNQHPVLNSWLYMVRVNV
jgi:FkbM family methyltransferase